MNDVLAFESNLAILMEPPPSENFQNFQLTLDNLNQFCNSKDGFIFLINNLPNFQNVASKKISLIVCKNWCLFKWDEIPNEFRNQIKALLFSILIQNFDEMPQDIRNIIGDSQCSFMWNTYPDEWPTFWEELLQMHPYVILNFLTAFCSYTSTLNYDSNDTFTRVKSSIRERNSDALILSFVFSVIKNAFTNLSRNVQIPFKILTSLIHWIPLNLILNNDSMATIINALNNPLTTANAFDALTSLIERGMESEMKMQIIDLLQIPPRVISLICNDADDNILYSAAQLIENTGSFLINYSSEKVLPFYHISLQLLTNKDNNISGCVAPFIQQYTRRNPDVSSIVLNVSYPRLKDYYFYTFESDLFIDENVEDEAYCEMLFAIIRVCFQADPDDSLSFLLSICESIDVVNQMSHCIALIEILNDQKPQPEFVKFFEPLLSLSPPLSPHQTKALSSYVRFFSSVAGSFEASAITNFFTRISEFVLCPMIKEEARSILSFSLLGFTKKYQNFYFDQSVIFSFVRSFDSNLAQISALLISRLDSKEFFDTFQSCLSHLFSELQSDQGLCPLVLNFIKSLSYVEGSPHIPIIQNFLSQIQSFVKTNDELQARFIRACFASLGPESSKLITDCIPDSKERLSISALCEVTTAIVKLLANQTNIDSAFNLLNHMFDSFISCFNEIDDWTIVNDSSIEIIEMVNNYLTLVESIISNISPVFLQKVFAFVSNILNSNSKYFCYQLLEKLLAFVYHASKSFPNETLHIFCSISISFLVGNRGFHPTHPGWTKVILKMVKFHATLLASVPAETIQIIAQTLTQESATPEMIQSYIESFKLTPKKRNDQCITFFEDFMKFKKSLC